MSRPTVKINPLCGERLKEVLREQDLTQSKLSKIMPLSQQTISHIIQGKANLTEANAKRIIELFPNYNLAWLLGIDDHKTKSEVVHEASKLIYSDLVRQKKAYSSMLYLIHLCGFDVTLDESLIIEKHESKEIVSIPSEEANLYYEELFAMLKAYTNFHFDRHFRQEYTAKKLKK